MNSNFKSDPFFKGWAKPGPIPQSLHKTELTPNADESLDALCGHYRVFQLKKGHRFSTDDLLTAWYGTTWCPSASRVLDLGSGIGSVGMTAAWRLQGAQFVTVEAQDISVALAKKSAQLNELEHRYEIRQGDLRDPELIHKEETFDLILGSPPYFPLDTGVLGDHPQKIACRFEVRGNIADYCQTAAQHLNWGGVFACIFPVRPDEQHQRVLTAAKESNLSIIRKRFVVFKEGEPALLGLFAMVRSDHLPEHFRNQTWNEPPLIIRTQTGEAHPEYQAIKLAVGLPPST